MVPGPVSGSVVPTRPRFTSDLLDCPCTDGKGSQDVYSTPLLIGPGTTMCCLRNIDNIIPKNLRRLQLKSQMFDHASDVVKIFRHSTFLSDEGSDDILMHLYKRKPLCVITDVFYGENSLSNTLRGQKEPFKNF